jgi:hypothetical protein
MSQSKKLPTSPAAAAFLNAHGIQTPEQIVAYTRAERAQAAKAQALRQLRTRARRAQLIESIDVHARLVRGMFPQGEGQSFTAVQADDIRQTLDDLRARLAELKESLV